jgi:hypothetical protein
MHRRTLQTLLASVIVPSLLLAQSGMNDKAPKAAPTAPLSKPMDMGTSDYRMFEDEPRKVKFRLVTSWISGEKHQGMFRYKLNAWVDKPSGDEGASNESDKSIEILLKRVSRCTITLVLYDKDEFILRKHEVPFISGVDPEHARLQTLFANDTFQMDAQEYRQFNDSGGWNIFWNCAFAPP